MNYNQMTKALNRALVYFKYTKPRVWLLLVFVGGVGATLAAKTFGEYNLMMIFVAVVSLIAGSAGSEAITNYVDRDIDSIMNRTKNRPLVTGKIEPKKGLELGIILVISSVLILLVFKRFLALCFITAGIVDNVIVYSYLLKRKTPWSIILGGFSGGLPVIVGWYTLTSVFSILPWFLFALIVVWIPIHIWSLAFRYKDDYRRAKVPMLPAVYSDGISAKCISFSAILLVVFSVIPYYFGENSFIYIFIVAIASIPMVLLAAMFVRMKDKKSSFRLFKYSSPYLTVIFLLFLTLKFF